MGDHFFILMTLMFESTVILLGEFRSQSLLGLKGKKIAAGCIGVASLSRVNSGAFVILPRPMKKESHNFFRAGLELLPN